jgi:hypothetical protein
MFIIFVPLFIKFKVIFKVKQRISRSKIKKKNQFDLENDLEG